MYDQTATGFNMIVFGIYIFYSVCLNVNTYKEITFKECLHFQKLCQFNKKLLPFPGFINEKAIYLREFLLYGLLMQRELHNN